MRSTKPLDGYKSDKSSTAKDIQRFKDQINLLNKRRDEASQKISIVKVERQRMFDQKQGRSISGLQSILSKQQTSLREILPHLSSLRTQSANISDVARCQKGAAEIERLILALQLKRDDFVKSFAAPEAAPAPYTSHVENWLNANSS